MCDFWVIFRTLALFFIPYGCSGYGIQTIPENDKFHQILSYSESVVSKNFHHLKKPNVLSSSTPPSKFLDEESTGSGHQVMAGIVVENYSKFQLTKPRSSGQRHCSYLGEIRPPQAIPSGASDIFVADNSEAYQRGVCGTVDWSLVQPDGEPLFDKTRKFGYRLITTFQVAYSGSCGREYGRHNQYSVLMAKVKVNSTGHLEYPDEFRGYFETFHTRAPTEKGWLYSDKGNTTMIALYDENRFLIRSHMERGCRPVLTIQFMPGPDFADSLLFDRGSNQPNAEKLSDGIGSTTSPAEVILNIGGFGGIATVALIFLGTTIVILVAMSIIIVAFVRRRKSKDRKLRRPYHK